uniref:18S rRNA (guanine-N(7))-methyltransferase n=1 Tax=Aceria tosichella TaxID=561515 RepID=A0A6G1SFG9_9ACAR
MSGRRPEHIAPPEIFYDYDEANKYSQNSRIMAIQESMTYRAIELLEFREKDGSQLILDLGCGSGLSSQCIEEMGHKWVGVDISEAMISVARERHKDEELQDLQIVKSDLGDGLPFKPGSFDGAISISALQWLCNADKSNHSPAKRLLNLFSTLYTCLTREGRAVFQFYPENAKQVELINQQALKAGFMGGIVIDNPESTKAKKFFLVLSCGGTRFTLPKAIDEAADERNERIKNEKRERIRNARKTGNVKSRDWILKKKERRRKKGEETKPDTKYTGRKRSGRF